MPRRVPLRFILFAVATLIIPVLLAACGAPADDNPQTTVDPAGPAAEEIDGIYELIWWLAVAVFVLVEGALVYAIFRFRGKKGHGNARPTPVHGNTRLEIIWTVIPAVILVVIAVPTIQGIANLAEKQEEDVMRLNVIGRQFSFSFEYADIMTVEGEPLTVANELHIPINTRVEITLISEDVIHSFWVPRLAGKTDLIPGRENHMWLEADEEGTYEGQCAEFCGLAHWNMRFTVVAETQEAFDGWVATQMAPPEDPVTAGREIVEGVCAACHTVEGTSASGTVGPELTNFANQPQIAGVLENNEENLRTWLADPPAVKPDTAMPNLGLTQQQFDALVAYLYTLDGTGGQ
jgi:cytochrome c oxidase subunit 2